MSIARSFVIVGPQRGSAVPGRSLRDRHVAGHDARDPAVRALDEQRAVAVDAPAGARELARADRVAHPDRPPRHPEARLEPRAERLEPALLECLERALEP